MFPRQTPAPAARFTLLIDVLCRAIAAQAARRRPASPALVLLWSWLRRSALRFARLAAPAEAGRTRRPSRPTPPRPSRARPRQRLPEGFAWVIKLVPEAASSATQLQHLLADAEVAAFIAATPQLGRILRPLCRMLGTVPPPAIAKPPPRQAAPATAETAARATTAPPIPAKTPPPPRRAPRHRARPAICGPPVPA